MDDRYHLQAQNAPDGALSAFTGLVGSLPRHDRGLAVTAIPCRPELHAVSPHPRGKERF